MRDVFVTPVDHETGGVDDNTFTSDQINIGLYPTTTAPTAYTFSGTSGTDELEGAAGADTLKGLGGDDLIVGNGGNDILVGGAGNDDIQGGLGTDTVDYSQESGGGAVMVNLATNSATDTFGNTDTLSGIENAVGTSGADTFTSAATGVNTFTGGLRQRHLQCQGRRRDRRAQRQCQRHRPGLHQRQLHAGRQCREPDAAGRDRRASVGHPDLRRLGARADRRRRERLEGCRLARSGDRQRQRQQDVPDVERSVQRRLRRTVLAGAERCGGRDRRRGRLRRPVDQVQLQGGQCRRRTVRGWRSTSATRPAPTATTSW